MDHNRRMPMPQLSTDLQYVPRPRTADPVSRRSTLSILPEIRYKMIAEAAYYLAEKRNFQGGDPVTDWLEAESMIDRALLAGVKPRLALQFLSLAFD